MNQSSNKSSMGQNRSNRTSMPVRPSQLRPLMPSNMAVNNATGPMRRPIFRSQIPIRARMEEQGSTQPQPNILEQRMHNLHPFTTPQRPAVPVSLSDTQSVVQSVDTAFTVYGERLQADLRDFRSLCTTLVVKEHQEKERWHSLCLKIMKERDSARQRMQALLAGQREPSPRAVSPPGSPTTESSSARGSKRAREEVNTGLDDEDMVISPKSEYRPICALRHSPIPSPPGSPPSYSSVALPPPPSSGTPSAPSSASSATSSEAMSVTSAPPYVTTFRASGSRSPSQTAEDTPAEHQPPVKRRKSSCDTSVFTPEELARDSLTKVEMRCTSRGRSPVTAEATKPPSRVPGSVALPGEFSHVDIMYVPMKGNLVCRACLLKSTKQSSSAPEPKTFPTNASWDDLRDHCITEHPAACVDVARLHPAEIFELRRRLNLSS
ncbi:hypothetical protein GALMADRAFT_229744 [Galerina marginata CBS 339.88]|uniref:Uncharacterized protein n=1 Tax=Galerina marginata (strain CBS 339.88) TaxID=685588 RepID=A0A067SM29_GALM3|nr:hypothetical protein GALMADRAFT_229744 [Galerina marginata CBS 339.88]